MEPRSVHKELWGQLSLSSWKPQSCAVRPGEGARGTRRPRAMITMLTSNGAKADPALVDIYRGIKTRDRFSSLSLHIIPSTPKEEGGTEFYAFKSDI